MKKIYDGNNKYIFVSYSHRDDEAKTIIDGLIYHNCRVWYDARINVGDEWDESIKEHLVNCEYFIALISKNFVASEYCNKELKLAIESNKKIMPFFIEPGLSISDDIAKIEAKDISEFNTSRKIESIINSISEEVFDIQDNILYEDEQKSIYFDTIIEKKSEGIKDDRCIKIFKSNKENHEKNELLQIQTPLGIEPKLSILSKRTVSNEYVDEDGNESILIQTLLTLINQSNPTIQIKAIISFLLENPNGLVPSAYIVGVKVISPLSGKYEKDKTLADLRNEIGEGGTVLIDVIEEQIINRTKEPDTLVNCLERTKKKTELVSVAELFSSGKLEKCYRIPDYQRGYAWKEEFEVLWKDIKRIYNSGVNIQTHYTGMLALEEMNDDNKKLEALQNRNAFYVADGQQRLTSIVIILNSLFEYIKEETNGEEDLSKDYLLFANGEYRFDYSVIRRDPAKHYFENRIYKNDTNVRCTDMYSENINRAREYIDETLKHLFDADEAKIILDIVLNRLLFNIYFISDFDVRVTFETMNNRGKPLTKLELLKNRLMYLSSFLGSESNETRLKEIINNMWAKIYENLGKGDDGSDSDDDYLRAHWFVYHGYNKSTSDKFIREILNDNFAIDEGKFHDLVSDHKYDEAYNFIRDYAESLGKYSEYWLAVNHPDKVTLSNDEFMWLDRLNRIASFKSYVKPAIMAVCGEQTNQVSVQEKCTLYQELERTIFIYKLLGFNKEDNFGPVLGRASDLYNANNIKEKRDNYNSLLKECRAYTDEISYKDVVKDAIKKLGESLNDKKQKFFYSWDGLSYFLYEYNNSFNDGAKRIDWNTIKKSSIEHIIPQDISDREYWKTVLNNISEEDQFRLINSLGNLLLLSVSENSYLGNHSFPVKKGLSPAYTYGYHYGTHSEQEVAEVSYWTPHEIYNRQDRLIGSMYRRWIDDGHNSISLEEFKAMLSENNLLTNDYPDISDEDKRKLDIDYSDEAEPVKPAVPINPLKAEVEEFKSYFNRDLYGIGSNSKKVTYYEDYFIVVINEGEIKCAVMSKGRKYLIICPKRDPYIKIESNSINGGDYRLEQDESVLPDSVRYYFKTLRRYLRRKGFNDVRLYEYRPPIEEEKRDELSQKLAELITNKSEEKGLELVTSDKAYVRFVSHKIRNKVGLHGGHVKCSWVNVFDLVVFEIHNDINDGANLTLLIGPSLDQSVRRKWFNFAQHIAETNSIFRSKKAMGDKWDIIINSIKLVKGFNKYESEEQYFEEALDRLSYFFDAVLPEIESVFDDAPDNIDDDIYK